MTADNNLKPAVIRLSQDHRELIAEISELTGVQGISNVVRYLIVHGVLDLREKNARPQVQPRRTPKTPEEKARRYIEEQAARKAAREAKILQEQTDIANALGGEIFTHTNGNPHVRYHTYDILAGKVVSYEQVEPLSLLTEDHIANQYKPNRAAVEAARATQTT